MVMTNAERQARYRLRAKARPATTLEMLVENRRQALIADWIRDTEDDAARDPSMADSYAEDIEILRAVAAQPPMTGEDLVDWFEHAVMDELQQAVTLARKTEAKARRVRMRKVAR